eukprot:1140699-Rhodomonas_salina.1
MNAAQEVDPLIFEADSPSPSPSRTPFQSCSNTQGTPGRTPQKQHVLFTPPGNPILANMTPQEAAEFALNATEAELSAAGFQRGASGGRGGGNADAV